MIDVVGVRVVGDHRLEVRFSDGSLGVRDFAYLAKREGTLVKPLADADFFARVFIDDGSLTWPNGYDFDPIALHDDMSAAGELQTTHAAE